MVGRGGAKRENGDEEEGGGVGGECVRVGTIQNKPCFLFVELCDVAMC